MKIQLTGSELATLTEENIAIDSQKDYPEDEASELLDSIMDAEVKYAIHSDANRQDAERAVIIAHLVDKVQDMIDRA